MRKQILVVISALFVAKGAFGIQTEFIPDGDCPKMVAHSYYSLCYVPKHRQSSWVKYKLTLEMINGPAKRKNDFRADPKIEDPVMGSDFKGSGFDRGHLAPAADMKLNAEAMSESFFMTNMSPQRPGFNRRIWAHIERRMRNLVRQYGTAHVVTAGVLEDDLETIESGVTIPNYYYKVAYFPEAQIAKAFLIEHKRAPKGNYYADYLVTVDEVEEATGYDFFSDLPDKLESAVESKLFRD